MRHHILTLLLGLAVLVTAGCGFQLRGNTPVPLGMQTLILDSYDPFGPVTRAVRAQLRANGVTIEQDAARKDVPSLRIINLTQNQDTVSIFSDGITAETQIAMTIQAQVLFPGRDIHPISVKVFRSFFDNPLTALAKDAEQEIILREMYQQAAQQLVRELQSVQAEEMITRQEAALKDDKTENYSAP